MIISGSDLEIYWLPSISPPSYFAHHNNKICCLHQRELDICFPCSKFAPHNTFCWLQIFDLGPSFQQKIISTASAKSKKKKKGTLDPGIAYCWIVVRLPNVLAPGSDIQIHVSWGTRLQSRHKKTSLFNICWNVFLSYYSGMSIRRCVFCICWQIYKYTNNSSWQVYDNRLLHDAVKRNIQ